MRVELNILFGIVGPLIGVWVFAHLNNPMAEQFRLWLWSKCKPKYEWHTFIGKNDDGWFACVAKTPGCVTAKYFPVKRLIHLGETKVRWDNMGNWTRACYLQKIAREEGFTDNEAL